MIQMVNRPIRHEPDPVASCGGPWALMKLAQRLGRRLVLAISTLAVVAAPAAVMAMTVDSPEWQALIAAAKAEGQISIVASSSRDYDPVYNQFAKKFGIKTVISYGGGSEHADRILAERRAGIYAVDVGHVGGNTVNRRIIPAGAVAPILPLLVLDEVKDPANWYDNQLWFGDADQKYVIAHSADLTWLSKFSSIRIW